MRMTTEEAFVKVLQRHGIAHAFGIIGSAFMPVSDLFDRAGITFWDVAHEGNGGIMCAGYTRTAGAIGMLIAQNGPGVTNFVTAVKTAYWNHTPMLLVTPQAANKTIGQGGFQEVEQMALFRDMVGYQEEVRDPSRGAEVLNRVIQRAKRLSAPAQINIPRDFFTHVIDIELPAVVEFERSAGGAEAIVLPEVEVVPEQLAERIQDVYERGKPHAIVVVAEGAKYNAEGLCKYFREHGLLRGYEFRSTVLGYVQRGAVPTCADRLLGTRLGSEAAEQIIAGNSGVLVGIIKGELTATPLEEVVEGHKPLDPWFLKAADMLAR